jgi:hypothetical protein
MQFLQNLKEKKKDSPFIFKKKTYPKGKRTKSIRRTSTKYENLIKKIKASKLKSARAKKRGKN